ncbi:MAG: DUF3810 domain-containing protein [Clostridia bacterium]
MDAKQKKSILIKLILIIIFTLIGIFLPKLLANETDFVERVFSRGIYPVVSRVVGAATSIVPFSIVEFLLYALVIGVPLSFIIVIVRIFKKKSKLVGLLNIILNYLLSAALILNVFYFFWGFNYSRMKLADIMKFEVGKYSKEELLKLSIMLADDAALLREDMPENKDGVFYIPKDEYAKYLEIVADSYSSNFMKELSPIFEAPVYKAKTVTYSEGLSILGISGIFIPFTEECNINVNQPTLYTFFDAAHENAHFLGIAREDEASFSAYLTCKNSDDAVLRYSATMSALSSCANKLNEDDGALYSELAEHYSDGMLRDFSNYNEYYDKYDTPVREISEQTNDNYLKHNNQETGIKSYGMMVDLLLAYYKID